MFGKTPGRAGLFPGIWTVEEIKISYKYIIINKGLIPIAVDSTKGLLCLISHSMSEPLTDKKKKKTHQTQVLEEIFAKLPNKAIVASGKTNNTIKPVH